MYKIVLLIFLILSSSIAYADLHDVGGQEGEFKGDGDKTPPLCQIDLPSGSTEPFSVRWNCSDDVSPDNEIRTELWLLRNGAGHAVKIEDFLGFPAAANIDASTLNSITVAAGLPAAFRLVARDRAGVATVSQYFTVFPQNNSLEKCSLSMTRAAIESDEENSGTPATTLVIEDVEVNTNVSSSNLITISTKTAAIADPCEIAAICDETDDGKVTFSATITTDSTSSGNITVSPGNFEATLTGTSTRSGSSLSSVTLSGTGIIDDVATQVELTCSN